jgi:hypothetical protein
VQLATEPEFFRRGFPVARPSERIIVIADLIERYLTEHPRAADTPKGICEWWVASQGHTGSLADVQEALDHLVELGRLRCTILADGTAIYARAGPVH